MIPLTVHEAGRLLSHPPHRQSATGWASVDATLGNHTVRFVSAHLADNSYAVGSAQAAELARGR